MTLDVSYSGVHTAFECALAAQEAGALRHFHTSLYDAPGCWGGLASRRLGPERLRNRRIAGLDPRHVREHPLPWLLDLAAQRLLRRPPESLSLFQRFDEHYARLLRRSPPDLLVTTERCALASLQAARACGTRTLHDCPQLHPVTLDQLMATAADRAGLRWNGFNDGPAMIERKLAEFALADRLMVYSDFQRDSFLAQGVPADRLWVNPLWVDVDFWHPAPHSPLTTHPSPLTTHHSPLTTHNSPLTTHNSPLTTHNSPLTTHHSQLTTHNSQLTSPPSPIAHLPSSAAKPPLELLFVGELSFRKGLPFLFEALRQLRAPVRLTLVGRPTGQFPIPSRIGPAEVVTLGPITKDRLRHLYTASHLMVLPSVADAFGWVAVEAMACGAPVLITANCGAPVPDPAWRVPALDSAALAARLQHYLDHPDQLQADAALARPFASQFLPSRFRSRLQPEFQALLHSR